MIKKLHKKNTLIFAILALIAFSVKAQDLTLDWANKMSGTGNESALSIALDANGDIYTIGNFNGTADFDSSSGTTNLTSNGGNDIFITKTDATGSLIWAKQIGGLNDDNATSITLDMSGNIIITGVFSDTVDFDPNAGVFNLNSNMVESIFVLKLNSSGEFIWVKKFGGTASSGVRSLDFDSLGNIYTTGYFFGTSDFDPGNGIYELTPEAGLDVFISKLTSNGDFVWAKQVEGYSDIYGIGLSIDHQDNVIVSGLFDDTIDIDPGSTVLNMTSNGATDIFVLKLDSTGGYMWSKQIGSSDYDFVRSIVTDNSGNSHIIGDFSSTLDLDPSSSTFELTTLGGSDIFICKLDSSGNFSLGKQIGGTANEFSFSSTLDASGDLYLTGRFEGIVNFDMTNTHNLASNGNADIFVAKYNSFLDFEYAQNFGGSGLDTGASIKIDNAGDIYTAGAFRNTVNFAVSPSVYNLSSSGGSDAFLQKLTFCALDNSVDTTGNTLTANSTIGSFQWINCNTNTDIAGETNQSFTPTTNGSYSVRVTNNNCVTTSDCQEVNSLSITELGLNNKTSIYPNPNDGIVNIRLNNIFKASLKVFTVFGQLIYSNQNIKSSHQFRLDEVSGIYIIEVEQQNKKQHFKLIKN